MSFISRYADWIKEAEDDLGAARHLLEAKKFSKACFHAQQAAEKAVKALLLKRCGRHEDIHGVSSLLETASDFMEVKDELRRRGSRLDRHYIPARYPNAWPAGAPHEHYSREDAEEAVRDAEAILEFVKASLG